MSMNLRCLSRYLFLSSILMCAGLWAQTDFGTIVGFVKDPSGGFIPKATVTLRNEATGVQQQVSTNDSGYYIAPNLPPGRYSISIAASGFKNFESSANKLDPDSTLSVDATLTVGQPSEKVEVVASASPLQTES